MTRRVAGRLPVFARRSLATQTLGGDATQRAFELGHTRADLLEVRVEERREPHRGSRYDRRRPLFCQEHREFAEHVAGAESMLRQLAIVGQDIGLPLLDEVNEVPEVVVSDDGAPASISTSFITAASSS